MPRSNQFVVLFGVLLVLIGCQGTAVLDDDHSDDDTGDDDSSVDDDDDTGDDDTSDDDATSPAIELNGTTDWGYVPSSPAFHLQELTVESWFLLNELPNVHTEYFVLVSSENRDGEGLGFKLAVVNAGGVDIQLRFVAWEAGDINTSAIGVVEFDSGEWHHAAGVVDDGELRVYLDGVEVGAELLNGPIVYGEQDLGFGWPCWSGNCRLLDGRLDEVRISSSARYDEAFAPAFEHTTVDEDTVGLWHMNEGKGVVLHEESSGQHHGTLTDDDVWSTRP